MASFLLGLPSLSPCLPTPRPSFKPPHALACPPIRFSGHPSRWKTRGSTVLTRAGPSSGALILAFALPFSLIAVTILISIKVSNKLDSDYLEELSLQKIIDEAEEYEDDDDDDDDDYEDDDNDDTNDSFLEEKELEPALPRTRQRPKREA